MPTVHQNPYQNKLVYYESMKRELKTRPIYECRCDERLKTKDEESTDTGRPNKNTVCGYAVLFFLYNE
jgi:hypothetical protein